MVSIKEALTFDDVLMLPRYSNILPTNTNINLEISKDTLKPKGVLVCKIFMGEDFIEVKNLAKSFYKKVNFFKPESSRKESKETYLHCEILKTL